MEYDITIESNKVVVDLIRQTYDLEFESTTYEVDIASIGTQGISVVDAEVTPSLNLIITLSNGATVNAGYIGVQNLDFMTTGTLSAGAIDGGTY